MAANQNIFWTLFSLLNWNQQLNRWKTRKTEKIATISAIQSLYVQITLQIGSSGRARTPRKDNFRKRTDSNMGGPLGCVYSRMRSRCPNLVDDAACREEWERWLLPAGPLWKHFAWLKADGAAFWPARRSFRWAHVGVGNRSGFLAEDKFLECLTLYLIHHHPKCAVP